MFEIVLLEYGLDHRYLRDNWTMQQLVLYMARRNERIRSDRSEAVAPRERLAPGERRRDEGLLHFIKGERKRGRVKRLKRASERAGAAGQAQTGGSHD